MPNFVVVWEIEVEDVDTPEEAAQQALTIMRDRNSIATVFTVYDEDNFFSKDFGWEVDLDEGTCIERP